MFYVSIGKQKWHVIIWWCTELFHGIAGARAAHFYSSPVQIIALAHRYNAWVSIFRNFATYLALDHIWHFSVFQIARLGPCGPVKVQGCEHAAVADLSWDEALEMGPTTWFSLGFGVRVGWRREVPPPLKPLCQFWVCQLIQMPECCPPEQRARAQRLDLVSSLSRDIWGPYSRLGLIINLLT